MLQREPRTAYSADKPMVELQSDSVTEGRFDVALRHLRFQLECAIERLRREVGTNAKQDLGQRRLHVDHRDDHREPPRPALSRVDAEQDQRSATPLRIELPEELVGASERGLEGGSLIGVRKIRVLEYEPGVGQRQPNVGVRQRELGPAGRANGRRRRG